MINIVGNSEIKKWYKVTLFSFFIVAILGLLLRYKMAFSLPWMNQKFTQHAHSHFAFAAWVSQAIWVFIYAILIRNHPVLTFNNTSNSFDIIELSPYQELVIILNRNRNNLKSMLLVHLLISYGMLLGFLFQGYGAVSITFSTLYLLVSFFMIAIAWDWINNKRKYLLLNSENDWQKDIEKKGFDSFQAWVKASFIFQLLSCFGTVSLVNQMIQYHPNQDWYLSSVYWFLHFTYNGWFFFGVIGIFSYYLALTYHLLIPMNIFWIFTVTCLPAYGLSILWLPINPVIYAFFVLAVIIQSFGYFQFILLLKKGKLLQRVENNSLSYWFLIFLFVALTSKMGLQLFSLIPSISKMAFGFRPVVIAYIHLMLLSVISVFLVFFGWQTQLISHHLVTKRLLWMFLLLIIINQLALGIQAVASLSYTWLPWINIALVFIAFFLAITIGGLFFISKRKN